MEVCPMTEGDRIRAGVRSLKGADKALYEQIKAIINKIDIAAALWNSPLGDSEYYKDAFRVYEMLKRGTDEDELYAYLSQFEECIDEEDLDEYHADLNEGVEKLMLLANPARVLEVAQA
jgi:hypothetical protein